jgi:hypothetical protein
MFSFRVWLVYLSRSFYFRKQNESKPTDTLLEGNDISKEQKRKREDVSPHLKRKD